MPAEILDIGRFISLSEGAVECRVKRSEDSVKIKLRTRKRLYTIKLDPEKVDEVIKALKCDVKEIT